jgi:hypothetical protein
MELGWALGKRALFIFFLKRARRLTQSLNADICDCFTQPQACPCMKAA